MNHRRAPRPDPKLAFTPPSSGTGHPVATGTWTSRRYAVYRSNDLIGTTALEYTLVFGEWAGGVFHLTPWYRHIAHVFGNLQIALEHDPQGVPHFVAERNRLGLELWLSGERLDGMIEMVTQWSMSRHVIHVRTSDPRVWSGRGN